MYSQKFISLLLLIITLLSCIIIVLLYNIGSKNNASMIPNTHTVHKEIKRGNTTWTEIRTIEDNEDPTGLYELWFTYVTMNPVLVNTFELGAFISFDWTVNDNGGINVSYWRGGPEGGTETKIQYDNLGHEIAQVQQSRPHREDEFIFSTPKGPAYTVTYLLSESCSQKNNADTIPEVELQGLSITYGVASQDYLLPVPTMVPCVRGDGFLNPSLTVTHFDKNNIDVELANGKTATISKTYNSYGTSLAPKVTFK